MDTLNHVCREADASAARYEIPLICVRATAFNEGAPALLSTHRRLLCMNMKQPNRLRLLNRQGKYAETDVRAPVLRHLVSSEGHSDYCAFFAAGGEVVSRLKPVTHADGEIQILQKDLSLQEEVHGVAVGNENTVYVLGKAHIFEVDMETVVKKATMGLASRTIVRCPIISFHHEARLLLAPAKSNCLDLISTSSFKSVLPKVWEPHGGSVPTAAFFLQRRNLANETSGNIFIVTAARGNAELRFWSYSPSTQTCSLRQDICISIEQEKTGGSGAADAVGEEESFLISCTPTEDYITLCSRRRPLAVVVELHRSVFKAVRVTSWKLNGPAIASVATVGKISEFTNSASVEYQLMLTVRTATGFYEEILNVEKFLGASNTTLPKQGSVDRWFPHLNANASDAAAALPTALTSVSSSVLGDKTTNAVSKAVASRALRQQAHRFCETLRGIDECMVDLQKRASNAMRLLQEARARDEAQTLGRNFAARNKGRLEQQQQMVGSSNGMTHSQQELLQRIRTIVKEMEPVIVQCTQTSTEKLISQRLKTVMTNGLKETKKVDLGPVAPAVRSADSTRAFSSGVDGAMQLLLRAVKDSHAAMQSSLTAPAASTAECLARAKEFSGALRRETQQLARELRDAKDAVQRMGAAATPVGSDVLMLRAVAAAEAKDWGTAFTIVLEADDIAVLLSFLEHQICTENMSLILQPQTIPLPTFVSLCLQLSFELGTHPDLISSRIHFLHAFYVEWDDTLKELKQKALTNTNDKSIFEFTKRELQDVLKHLELVKDQSVDRQTRCNIRLLKRLLGTLLANN